MGSKCLIYDILPLVPCWYGRLRRTHFPALGRQGRMQNGNIEYEYGKQFYEDVLRPGCLVTEAVTFVEDLLFTLNVLVRSSSLLEHSFLHLQSCQN
jgi:hypothetical protein